MKSLAILLSLLLISPASARDFRPPSHLENITASNSSIQQCYVFQTTPGVAYTVEVSSNLSDWTPQDEIYGLGGEYAVAMREFTPPPPQPPGTPSANPPTLASNVSLRLQPASGAAGGSVVAWRSLDHDGPIIVRIAAEIDPGWYQIPIFWDRFDDYYFYFWHPGVAVAPPTVNSPLGPKDSAMLAVLEASVPAINQQIAASIIHSRNAPPPAPSDPDSKRFWRVKVDWSLDTDQDGCPDWAEFEIAARGTGMLVPGVIGDAFNADTNNDGIPDGKQLDADGDGTPDADDPDPDDNTATFPISPIPRYALFPITNAAPPENAPWALQINDKGRVLYEIGTWCGGVWTRLVDPGGIPPFSIGGPQQAHAYAINDHDVILGVSGRQVGSLATEFASVRCFWSTPTAAPLPVKSSQELGAGYAGHLTSNIAFHGDLYRPQLSNDGRFTADYSYWESNDDPNLIGREITEPAMWTLPTTGALSTHTPLERSIIFHGDPSLSWGYSVPMDESGSEVGERTGKVLNSGGATPILPFIPENVVSVEGRTMAFPLPYSDKPPVVLIENKWKDSPFYQGAFDISKDGVAIGLPARFQVNGKWLNIEKAAPGISAEWQDASVRLLDTTASGWILAGRENSVLQKDNAILLPIRAEGYYSNSAGVSITEAVGVDDFSIGSETPGVEVQDKIWIMAPQGGFNKIVKFKSPLNANTPVNLSASNILFGGQESTTISGAISPVVLRAADTVLSGGERVMTLTMGNWSNEVSSISKPIGLKIMKERTVKVTVYKVTKLYGTSAEEEVDAVMMPTQNEIIDHLNDMFRPQINTIFSVNLVAEPLEARWDAPSGPNGVPNGHFDIQTGTGDPEEEAAILAEVPANPPAYDIRVFIVANPGSPLGTGADAFGLTLRDQRTCWVHGSLFGKNRSKSYLLDTIAHEIGHVLVGEGHPDKTTGNLGPAPLPGTRHNCRLMCSGPNSNGSSRLLVKKEWDEAEKWMKTEIDDKEPQ